MSKTYNPRDFKPIPYGEGWIVKSPSTDGWLGDGDGEFRWFNNQGDAQTAADDANNYVSKREAIARAWARVLRGGREMT